MARREDTVKERLAILEHPPRELTLRKTEASKESDGIPIIYLAKC